MDRLSSRSLSIKSFFDGKFILDRTFEKSFFILPVVILSVKENHHLWQNIFINVIIRTIIIIVTIYFTDMSKNMFIFFLDRYILPRPAPNRVIDNNFKFSVFVSTSMVSDVRCASFHFLLIVFYFFRSIDYFFTIIKLFRITWVLLILWS